MPSRRVQKAAQAVREVVSMAILTDLNDPRVENVTVTYVEMTPDMRQAKVYVSIMGSETKQRLVMAGLKSAAGYLQSKVASRIDTRYTPRLEFVLDQGVKKSIQIAEILGRVLPAEAPGQDQADAGSADAQAHERGREKTSDPGGEDEFE
ncbi:MAG: 30S ribosome-binding factor RbfA [Pirellulales bacterium]